MNEVQKLDKVNKCNAVLGEGLGALNFTGYCKLILKEGTS